jgi:hypothetical protein
MACAARPQVPKYFREEDESPFVGLLQVEAAEARGWYALRPTSGPRSRNPPTALAVLWRTAHEPNR